MYACVCIIIKERMAPIALTIFVIIFLFTIALIPSQTMGVEFKLEFANY